MKYTIQSNNGQWWNGLCWGEKWDREEIELCDLPLAIHWIDEDGYIVTHSLLVNNTNPLDIEYHDTFNVTTAQVYEAK